MKSFFFLLIQLLTFSALIAQDLPADLQARIDSELEFLQGSFAAPPGSRSLQDLEQVAISSVFTSEAIRLAAAEGGVAVTDDEIVAALQPMLTRNGLIDPEANNGDWRSDANVLRWLEAQGQSLAQFLTKGRDFALFMKLCLQKTGPITPRELDDYVAQNPALVHLPDRVQLHFTRFAPPEGTTRSVQNLAVMGLELGALRSASQEVELLEPPTSVFDEIQYWYAVQSLDPVLSEAIAGMQAGDAFGPLRLTSGALVAGEVKAFRPSTSLPASEEVVAHVLFSLAMEKNGQDVFATAADKLVSTRGFFGSIWKGLGKGFRYVAAAGGGVGGFLLGGPSGAMAGARLGWGIGGALQSWYRNPQQVPQTALPNWNWRVGQYSPGYGQSSNFPIRQPWQGAVAVHRMDMRHQYGRVPTLAPWERPNYAPTISHQPPSWQRGVLPIAMGVFY